MKRIYVSLWVFLLALAGILVLMMGDALMPALKAPAKTPAPTVTNTQEAALPAMAQSPATDSGKPTVKDGTIRLAIPYASVQTAPESLSLDMPDVALSTDNRYIRYSKYMETDSAVTVLGMAPYTVSKATGAVQKAPEGFVAQDGANRFFIAYDSAKNQYAIVKEGQGLSKPLYAVDGHISGLFTYNGKLYFRVSSVLDDALWRMNYDGSNQEKVLQNADMTLVYKGKAYYCTPTDLATVQEASLETGKTLRTFDPPEKEKTSVIGCVTGNRMFFDYGNGSTYQTAVVDIDTGRTVGAFERGFYYEAFGQYLFYITFGANEPFKLKAYNTDNGKCYYVSDMQEINELRQKKDVSDFRPIGMGSAGKNLYFSIWTETNLYLYRFSVSDGRGKVETITSQKLPS